MIDLPRSLTWPPTSGSAGRCLHCPTVGPQTSREEIRNLYYQVYKLWRLPGSPLCGPEQAKELARNVVSSLKNCLRWRGGEPLRVLGEYKPAGAWPSCSKTPRRRRRDTSAKRDFTEAREAHWRALAAILEERIKRLSCSTTRGWQDTHTHSQSCNCWRRRSQGRTEGTAGPYERTALPIPLCTALPSGAQGLWKARRVKCLSWNLT